MKCPYCTNENTKVVDSRLNQFADITRRRRECNKCEGRFTTYERVEEIMPVIIKKDGRREAFIREKLLGGIQSACQKLSIPTEKIETIVSKIEKKIQSFGLKEMPSRAVGELVMKELHHLHKVAYVRFASVYREFKDVEEFVEELKDAHPEPIESTSLSFPFAEKSLDKDTAPKSTSQQLQSQNLI